MPTRAWSTPACAASSTKRATTRRTPASSRVRRPERFDSTRFVAVEWPRGAHASRPEPSRLSSPTSRARRGFARLGADAYADALAEHRRALREAFVRNDGVEVDTQGDSFFVAFSTAPAALSAAVEAQEMLASGPIRVRMGIHTGTNNGTRARSPIGAGCSRLGDATPESASDRGSRRSGTRLAPGVGRCRRAGS